MQPQGSASAEGNYTSNQSQGTLLQLVNGTTESVGMKKRNTDILNNSIMQPQRIGGAANSCIEFPPMDSHGKRTKP